MTRPKRYDETLKYKYACFIDDVKGKFYHLKQKTLTRRCKMFGHKDVYKTCTNGIYWNCSTCDRDEWEFRMEY